MFTCMYSVDPLQLFSVSYSITVMSVFLLFIYVNLSQINVYPILCCFSFIFAATDSVVIILNFILVIIDVSSLFLLSPLLFPSHLNVFNSAVPTEIYFEMFTYKTCLAKLFRFKINFTPPFNGQLVQKIRGGLSNYFLLLCLEVI